MRRRLLVTAVLAGVLLPWLVGVIISAEPPKDTREFRGKVVAVAAILEREGAPLDKDAAAAWLALLSDDGKLLPLVKDAGSRMLFKDERLRDRPVVLRGRLVGREQFLQVFQVATIVAGRRHEPFYWCDICKIKRFEPNDCDCCGAPLEFREEPVDR